MLTRGLAQCSISSRETLQYALPTVLFGRPMPRFSLVDKGHRFPGCRLKKKTTPPTILNMQSV